MQMELSPLVTYCDGLAAEFDSRLNRIRSFVGHNLTSGTANEEILRTFLSEHASKRYTVAEGFIVNPFLADASSKQCDVLVFDALQYPVLHEEGGVKIIMPNSAKMVIEVKTNLDSEAIQGGIENIKSAKYLNPSLSGVIFGFDGVSFDTTYNCLKTLVEGGLDADYAPIAIINLRQGVLASRAHGSTELGGDKGGFYIYHFKDKPNAVLVYFMLLFYDIQMLSVPGGAEMANAWRHLLKANPGYSMCELAFVNN
jgi:hypothetical protein